MFALLVLFSMNLLNYVDRYVLAAVGKAIQADLRLPDDQFGWLGSAFIIVYTIVSPVVGWLGDRTSRRKLLAFGVGLWSVATVGTAFAANFGQMFLARAILGVGEASYGVVAPTLLADLFTVRSRGRVMGVFYLALPVGTAIGYGVGGFVQKLATDHAEVITAALASVGLGWLAPYMVEWRAAFWVVGIPGIVLALCGLIIHEPKRGASDAAARAGEGSGSDSAGDGELEGGAASIAKPVDQGNALDLLKTPSYLLNTAGMAAVTFTTGAFGHWMPNYFQRVHGTKPEEIWQIGIALAAAGLIGVLMGMWLPDRLRRITKRAYMLWAAAAVLLAVPFGAVGLVIENRWLSLVLLFVASVMLSSCLGPCNTVTANVVAANRRAAGYALSIFLLHLLGDIPSPWLIGKLSVELASPEVRASASGQFLESIGAKPSTPLGEAAVGHDELGLANLTAGMLVIIPVLLIGAACFFIGAKFLPRDEERAAALSAGQAESAAGLIH
jgi:MFS family permease